MAEWEMLCGCKFVETAGFGAINYCPRHAAADPMYEALASTRNKARKICLSHSIRVAQYFAKSIDDVVCATLVLVDGKKEIT